jgi:hypothetical protein
VFAIALAALLLLAAATAVGSAVLRLTSVPAPGLAAPVGFAALLTAGGLCIRLPSGGDWAAAALAALVVGSLAYILAARPRPSRPGWRFTMAVMVVLLAMVPFAAIGHGGLLGVGTNDDMAEHLTAAWALQGHAPSSVSKLIQSGYPLGPHALAATLSTLTGLSLEHAFTGLAIAVPAFLALAAVALLPEATPALRATAGALVGLCYLQCAYLVQMSFKEPIESVLLVASVALLASRSADLGGEIARRASPFALAPLAILLAATTYANSFVGLLWPVAAILIWGATHAGLSYASHDRVQLHPGLRAVPFAGGVALFLALVAPNVSRMISFANSGYNHEGRSVLGNLLKRLPPLEGVGIWPRLDFRFGLPTGTFGGVVALIAFGALVLAVLRSLARRDLAVPAALLGAAALFGVVSARSPYTSAKALAIGAPLVTLVLARETLLLYAGGNRRQAATAVGGAFLLAVGAYSDLELLRDGPVGPASHPRQLATLRSLIGQRPTLVLSDEDYLHWELRGANIATPPAALYAGLVVPLRRERAQPAAANYTSPRATTTISRFAGLGLAFDFDSVPPAWLDRFAYVIRPRSGYTAPPPPNWIRRRVTESYELWGRRGPTAPYASLTTIDNPGARLDCMTPAGRRVSRMRGLAMVQPAPVVGERTAWRGEVGYAGRTSHQNLHLARGTWVISLQYAGSGPVSVHALGMDRRLPATLEPLGPYWYVGPLHLRATHTIRVNVTPDRLPTFGRLIGASGLTRPPAPTGLRALGRITASRPASASRLIPLRRACGRYIDWYRLTAQR